MSVFQNEASDISKRTGKTFHGLYYIVILDTIAFFTVTVAGDLACHTHTDRISTL